jgi:two-component sensor histidine kinase
VRWALAEEGMATLDWSESGGPPVTPPPPERRGFGVRLLERGTAHDLGPDAEVRLTFATEGVQAVLRFRVAAPMREAEATP